MKERRKDENTREGLTWEERTEQDGLPWAAFALVGDRDKPGSWQLPHHTREIKRAIRGKIGLERTVDWEKMVEAVEALGPQGLNGVRVHAQPHEILSAANHLAVHYRKAGKPLPNTLAILT